MIATALLIITAALAFINPWWLVATILVSLWKLNHWRFYRSRPWRRVHFPAMRLYAGELGFATGRDERDDTMTPYQEILGSLVKTFFPEMPAPDIAAFIEREYDRCRTFADKRLIADYLKKKNPKLDEADLDQSLESFRPHMNPNDRFAISRLIVAGIIEGLYSKEERAEYMFEVLNGRAK